MPKPNRQVIRHLHTNFPVIRILEGERNPESLDLEAIAFWLLCGLFVLVMWLIVPQFIGGRVG